jgi:hypothetical protein
MHALVPPILLRVTGFDALAVRAVGPADREISVAIEPVVERTGKAKSVCQETSGWSSSATVIGTMICSSMTISSYSEVTQNAALLIT